MIEMKKANNTGREAKYLFGDYQPEYEKSEDFVRTFSENIPD